jgi:ferritin-like metal-binding protein YciE
METLMAAKRRSRKQSPDCNELLVMELQEIHNAETQLARALPRLTKAVQSEELQEMVERRQQEGERLLEEVAAALEELEESPGRRKNSAAEGLINAAREHVQELQAGPALDAVLIGAIQKTEHYCIAAWGTARSLAQTAEQRAAVKAMERALKEGKRYDEQLTQLAESEINPQLMPQEEGEEEEEEQPRQRARSRRGSGSERRVPT